VSGVVPDRAHLDRVIGTCLHCGLCLPTCPTYDLTLDERSSPRGRIRLIRSVLDGSLSPGRAFADEMNFCLDCRACETACPAGVRYGELVEHARALALERGLEPLSVRIRKYVLLRWIFGSGRTFAVFGALMRFYRKSGLREAVERSGLLDLFPASFRRTILAFPDVADEPFLGSAPDLVPALGSRKGRAALLTGCVMNVSFPDVHRQTADLLSAQAYEVVIPRGQFCCGSLHAHNGDPDHAARLAAGLLDVFPPDIDLVVTNSAGCGAFMKEYGRLFAGDAANAGRARDFAGKVADVSEVLSPGAAAPVTAGGEGHGPILVTYHDACHLVHGQGISKQPRALVASAAGTTYVELANAARCCGSAGIYNILRPADSDALLRGKVDAIVASGARIVVTGNPGCHLQIERGLREAGSPAEVVHPVTLLWRVGRGEPPGRAGTR
jgi:glycolate oxidase iron-sulfur subunit